MTKYRDTCGQSWRARASSIVTAALVASACYGVVGEEGIAPPIVGDAGPKGTGGSSSGGATTGGTGGGSGGSTSGGGTGNGGATGTGGSGATGGAGGTTGTGGATGTGGSSGAGGAGKGGAGAGGTGAAGGSAGTSGTGGTAGTSGTGGSAGIADAGKGGNAGTPDAGGGLDVNVPAVCTSMMNWTNGNSQTMRPGAACKSCHSDFTIAGTVYPTLHEPLNCNGKSAVQVVITPASGTALMLTTNTAGNFYSTAKITTPYTAKVVVNGMERPMMATQTNGDCNSCHTQNGASNAPGRVIVP